MTGVETEEDSAVPLTGRVAVVTGAARGIGEAIAQTLARMGARVVLTARDPARLARAREAIEAQGGQALAAPCDLTSETAVNALRERVGRECGRCDILVNNAGIAAPAGPLIDLAVEDWDRVMSTNLRAPYLTIRAFAPMMIAANYGHIIQISSLAGRNALPNGAAYSASKWGLNGLTNSVAEELRPYNVRVAMIAPGSVDTRFGGGDRGKDRSKMIQPADVARVVAMLVTQTPNSFVSEVLLRPTQKP